MAARLPARDPLRRLRRAGSLLLLGVGWLAACELAVRYYQRAVPAPRGAPYVSDPASGYRLQPHPSRRFAQDDGRHVNLLGFRDRDRALPKPAGMYRVLGIGDSFVYGEVPPTRNFLRLAEQAADSLLPAPLARPEVALIGLPGWNTENQVGILEALAPSMAPDLVVLAFSVGSDVTGIPVRGVVRQGNLQFAGAQKPWLNLLRKSHLFVLGEQFYRPRLRRAIRNLLDTPGQAAGGAAPAAAASPGAAPRALSLVNREHALLSAHQLPLFADPLPPRVAAWWRDAERQLAAFDAAARRVGVPWLLLVVPIDLQVDPQLRAAVLAKLDRDGRDLDLERPQARLRAFADAHGTPVLDPLPTLRREWRPVAPLHLPNNGHWDAHGNRVVGALLGEAIAERALASAGGDQNRK